MQLGRDLAKPKHASSEPRHYSAFRKCPDTCLRPAKVAHYNITHVVRHALLLLPTNSDRSWRGGPKCMSHVPIISDRRTHLNGHKTMQRTAANMYTLECTHVTATNEKKTLLRAYFVCVLCTYIFSKSMNGHACACLVSGGGHACATRALTPPTDGAQC